MVKFPNITGKNPISVALPRDARDRAFQTLSVDWRPYPGERVYVRRQRDSLSRFVTIGTTGGSRDGQHAVELELAWSPDLFPSQWKFIKRMRAMKATLNNTQDRARQRRWITIDNLRPIPAGTFGDLAYLLAAHETHGQPRLGVMLDWLTENEPAKLSALLTRWGRVAWQRRVKLVDLAWSDRRCDDGECIDELIDIVTSVGLASWLEDKPIPAKQVTLFD